MESKVQFKMESEMEFGWKSESNLVSNLDGIYVEIGTEIGVEFRWNLNGNVGGI